MKMILQLTCRINRLGSGLTNFAKIHRNYYSRSEKGIREYEKQLSKFNGKCDDYESKIDAARSIALAMQSDEKLSLNTRSLAERNREQILYNVTGGRHWRFKICYNTYQKLAPKSMLTNEHLLRVAIMGYLSEQLLSAYIVLDDVYDHSELRRNKIPWYKKEGRNQATNDAIIMLQGAFIVMKQLFRDQPYYKRCAEILGEANSWLFAQGQSLDMTVENIFQRDTQYFNMETYRKLAFAKMAGNCFYAPMATATVMANYDFKEFHDELVSILTDMGVYVLMENDYCDRYGNQTGKMLDEDIKNGKLSWMILKAYQHANTDQQNILRECYGKGDVKSSIAAVIDVYEQIGMKDIAEAFRKESFENIHRRIKELPDPRFQDATMYPLEIIKGWYRT